MFNVDIEVNHPIEPVPKTVETYIAHIQHEENKQLYERASKIGLHPTSFPILFAQGDTKIFRILKSQTFKLFSNAIFIPFIDINIDTLIAWMGTMANKIATMRLIFSNSIDITNYSALLIFKEEADAKSFYELYNGKAFNDESPEYAILIFVVQVCYLLPKQKMVGESYNCMTLELPFCPLCLERIDVSVSEIWAISSIFSNLCAQTGKWTRAEKNCPTCSKIRFKELSCEYCKEKQSLWICLLCSKVGCGRYVKGHASKHFEESGHPFSLEYETERIWNYRGDNYVHRIIKFRQE